MRVERWRSAISFILSHMFEDLGGDARYGQKDLIDSLTRQGLMSEFAPNQYVLLVWTESR